MPNIRCPFSGEDAECDMCALGVKNKKVDCWTCSFAEIARYAANNIDYFFNGIRFERNKNEVD